MGKKFTIFLICIFLILIVLNLWFFYSSVKKENVHTFDLALTLPGCPEEIYDAMTGDISGWWDHTFSEEPVKLYIEPHPGGGFYEIFNDHGDGVLHATVMYAERGKLLRFEGPLGLSGRAVQLVCTYTFLPVANDSTRLVLSVHGSGGIDSKLFDVVEGVWHHFLIEQFKPYVENGCHLK